MILAILNAVQPALAICRQYADCLIPVVTVEGQIKEFSSTLLLSLGIRCTLMAISLQL